MLLFRATAFVALLLVLATLINADTNSLRVRSVKETEEKAVSSTAFSFMNVLSNSLRALLPQSVSAAEKSNHAMAYAGCRHARKPSCTPK